MRKITTFLELKNDTTKNIKNFKKSVDIWRYRLYNKHRHLARATTKEKQRARVINSMAV